MSDRVEGFRRLRLKDLDDHNLESSDDVFDGLDHAVCGHCIFAKRRDADCMECHRHPPVVLQHEEFGLDGTAVWPRVKTYDFCGEFLAWEPRDTDEPSK